MQFTSARTSPTVARPAVSAAVRRGQRGILEAEVSTKARLAAHNTQPSCTHTMPSDAQQMSAVAGLTMWRGTAHCEHTRASCNHAVPPSGTHGVRRAMPRQSAAITSTSRAPSPSLRYCGRTARPTRHRGSSDGPPPAAPRGRSCPPPCRSPRTRPCRPSPTRRSPA